MNQPGANQYLRTRVLTATPEQLQMMLYDGALAFCQQARAALTERNYEQSYSLISKVQKIVVELNCSLKPELAPELCQRLSALYVYAYRKLIEANTRRTIEALDEAVNILRYQRETWAMLMEQMGRQKAASAAGKLDIPEPSARMEASISVQG
jgi:flagellar protein FliS